MSGGSAPKKVQQQAPVPDDVEAKRKAGEVKLKKIADNRSYGRTIATSGLGVLGTAETSRGGLNAA